MKTGFSFFNRLFGAGGMIILLYFAIGCSGHDNSGKIPAIPSTQSDVAKDAGYQGNKEICWGIWDVILNDSGEFEIVPLRHPQYTINVIQFLQPPAGSLANMSVFIVNDTQLFTTGRIIVDVQLKHPFPAYKEYAGFDVRGIFIHNGANLSKHDSSLRYAKPGTNAFLLNADGYTRWMNRSEFTVPGLGGYTQGALGDKGISWDARANPYKYFCDGLETNESITSHFYSTASVNDRGVFRAGATNTRRYDLTFPISGGVPSVAFQYAVLASWIEPSVTPPNNVPGDFPANANCAEPIHITASSAGSTTYWNSPTDKGGNLLLTLEIFDHGAKNDPQSVAGQITEIIVESPNNFIPGGNVLIFNSGNWTKQPGSTQISQKFVLNCGAVDPQGPNPADNPVFVAVTSATGSYDTGVGTPYPDKPLRTYQYFRINLTGGSTSAPGDVTGFSASDGDVSLNPRTVKLTWNNIPEADQYVIQRNNYNTATKTWVWENLFVALAGETSYIDGNARYSGVKNPIQYRIRAENEVGQSPSWVVDTGYPKKRGIKTAYWCVADNASGQNAVVTWARAIADFNDCKEFWAGYGFDIVMKNSGAFFWVTNPAYRQITGTEDAAMHNSYGKVQHPDAINVYYVESADGSSSLAYCHALCPGSEHKTVNTFIILCKDARPCGGSNEYNIILAHEMGHAMTRFWDVYLMDLNADGIMNDGTSCAINTWCNGKPPFLPYQVPVMYCDEAATYPQEPGSSGKVPKNLMWYSYCGAPVSQYDLTVGQYIEASSWIRNNESGYPAP